MSGIINTAISNDFRTWINTYSTKNCYAIEHKSAHGDRQNIASQSFNKSSIKQITKIRGVQKYRIKGLSVSGVHGIKRRTIRDTVRISLLAQILFCGFQIRYTIVTLIETLDLKDLLAVSAKLNHFNSSKISNKDASKLYDELHKLIEIKHPLADMYCDYLNHQIVLKNKLKYK